MRLVATGFLALAACQSAVPALPWVRGLDDVAASTGIDRPSAPGGEVEPGCGAAASRSIELSADVAPAGGSELIVGSFRGGLAIFDREDHLLAETSGYPCSGSADELDVIAVGSAYGDRMLVLAATTGGHREAWTWVALYRLDGRSLDPVFAGMVEHRDEAKTTRGSITFIPGGLLHEPPGGPIQLWRRDPDTRVYIPVLPEPPHDEPAVALGGELASPHPGRRALREPI